MVTGRELVDGYANCFDLAISNAQLVGFSAGGPSEAGPFPAFFGPGDCGVAGTTGSYWDVHDVTFTINGQCAVSTQHPTWGSLKSM